MSVEVESGASVSKSPWTPVPHPRPTHIWYGCKKEDFEFVDKSKSVLMQHRVDKSIVGKWSIGRRAFLIQHDSVSALTTTAVSVVDFENQLKTAKNEAEPETLAAATTGPLVKKEKKQDDEDEYHDADDDAVNNGGALHTRIAILEQELMAQKQTIFEQNAEITRLNSQLINASHSTGSSTDALQQNVVQLTALLRETEAALKGSQKAALELNKDIAAKNSKLNRDQKTIEDLNDQVTALKTKLSDQAAATAQAEQEKVDDGESKYIAELTEKNNVLQAQLADAQATGVALERRLATAAETIADVTAQVDALNTKAVSQSGSIADKEKQMEDYRASVQKLQADLQAANAEYKKQKAAAERLQQENAAAEQKRLQDLEAQQKKYEIELANMTAKMTAAIRQAPSSADAKLTPAAPVGGWVGAASTPAASAAPIDDDIGSEAESEAEVEFHDTVGAAAGPAAEPEPEADYLETTSFSPLNQKAAAPPPVAAAEAASTLPAKAPPNTIRVRFVDFKAKPAGATFYEEGTTMSKPEDLDMTKYKNIINRTKSDVGQGRRGTLDRSEGWDAIYDVEAKTYHCLSVDTKKVKCQHRIFSTIEDHNKKNASGESDRIVNIHGV